MKRPTPDIDRVAVAKVKALLESVQEEYDSIKRKRKAEFIEPKARLKEQRDALKEKLKELTDVKIPHNADLDDIQRAILGYDEYEKQAEHGVTSLSIPRYKKWVELNYEAIPDETDGFFVQRLDSIFGTAFHNYAEKILSKAIPELSLEESIVANVGGYEVGGTADIVDRRSGKAKIADHKTTKTYSAKKALGGEVDKWIYQMSIYRYLLEVNGEEVEDVGTIYVWVTGWTPRDSDSCPKLFSVDLPLMSSRETHDYIIRQIEATEDEPEMDCETWLCPYCDHESVCPKANLGGFQDFS